MFDLPKQSANTSRAGAGSFFFIYPFKAPKGVELKNNIPSTGLISKYDRILAIEGTPAPQLMFQPHSGAMARPRPSWLFLF